MPKNQKTITENALIRRINRALRPSNEQLRRPRSAATRANVGDICIWSWTTNVPGECHVDLIDLARRLGVLAADEDLAAGAEG